MSRVVKSVLVTLTGLLSGCFSPSEYVYLNLDYARTGHLRGGELRVLINGERPDFFGKDVSKIAPDAFGATDQAMIQKFLKEGENTIEVEFVRPNPPPSGDAANEPFAYSIAISRVKKGEMVDTAAPGNLYDTRGELQANEPPKPIKGTFGFQPAK